MTYSGRYLFGGTAVAIAARIRRIRNERVDNILPDFVSAGLPPIGGKSHAVSVSPEALRYSDVPKPDNPGLLDPGLILSFQTATASISGDFKDAQLAFEQTQGHALDVLNEPRIVAETTLDGLIVRNIFKVGRIESQLIEE